MSKKYQLPRNCEVEVLDYDRKDRPFRLRFYAGDGNDYLSEVYHPAKGQRLKAAAHEVCQRYGWLEFPPATGMLTREELEKLDDLVENAISDMDRNPGRYVPDPEKFWRDLFDWADDDQEFFMDGNDLLACGDPPIPVRDGDEWVHYNYAHDIGRIIPRAVSDIKVESGPRGIEVVRFQSGDMDGDWETDAKFVRRQPGAILTKADWARAKETRDVLDAAHKAYRAVDSGSADYEKLREAWSLASRAHAANGRMSLYDDDDYWNPREFQDYAVQLNCYWTLLRYKRYQIWCALHGEDPLGNVMHEYEQVAGVYDVTVTTLRGVTTVATTRVSGNRDLEAEALKYIGDHTVPELRKLIRKRPKGVRLKPERFSYSINHGWKPRKVARGSVTLRVSLKGTRSLPITPERVRKVSCKGLEEDVKRMLAEIAKHYPPTK